MQTYFILLFHYLTGPVDVAMEIDEMIEVANRTSGTPPQNGKFKSYVIN